MAYRFRRCLALRVYFRGRRNFWDPRVSIPVLIPISIGLPLTFLTLNGWVVGLPLILLALYLLFDKMGWVYVVDSEGVKVLRRRRVEGFIPLHVIGRLTVRVRGGKPRDWGRVTLGFACLFIGGGLPMWWILDVGDITFLGPDGRRVLTLRGVKVSGFLEALGRALRNHR